MEIKGISGTVAGDTLSADEHKRKGTPEVPDAEAQGTAGGSVHNVNTATDSKKRRNFDAQELRGRFGEIRRKAKEGQTPERGKTEGLVQGRSDIGKKLAQLINEIPGEGPGRRTLGLDRLGTNKDTIPGI